MSDFINQISQKAEYISETLSDFYSKNAKSNDPNVQKVIDWAPTIIIAVGFQLAPALALATTATALLVHLKNPKIITSDMVKTALTGVALNFAANSILPVAKAAVFISLAATIYVSAKFFDELKEVAQYALDGKFNEAFQYSSGKFETKKNEMTQFLLSFLKTA